MSHVDKDSSNGEDVSEDSSHEAHLLRERLEQLRKRRTVMQRYREQVEKQSDETLERLNQLRQERQSIVEQYQSVLCARKRLTIYLQHALRWNVTNDCFFIWHNGPFATINSMRLGSEAPPLPFENAKEASPFSSSQPAAMTGNKQNTDSQPPPRRYFLWSGSGQVANQDTMAPKPPTEVPKVPWMEVNAALGYVALLFRVLQEHTGFQTTHELHPMASSSKIAIRPKHGQPSMYNLHFEAGYTLFPARNIRNFNIALQGLLQCIAEASLQQKDKTIAIPHTIIRENNEWKIGGLAITYDNLHSLEWTRVCKYLLTDLKWLVAYAVKHVDR